MLLPRASDLEEELTIDWDKVLDNMPGTPLIVKFKLTDCSGGLLYNSGNGLLPSFFMHSQMCFVCIIAVHYNCYNVSVANSSFVADSAGVCMNGW